MNEYILGITSAFWFGVLTSISPCPLATNIAAISYIGRKTNAIKTLSLSGILYSIGRMLAYTVLGLLITWGLLAIPSVSLFLQKYINIILGPVLVIVGMFLLELLNLNFRGSKLTGNAGNYFKDSGAWGALPLGIIFALAFCPISAALFFGSLIPIALRINSPILSPSVYGLGTAIPVLVFTFFLALGSKSIGLMFTKITTFEKWVRLVTGILIVLIGIYLSMKNIFLA